MFEHTINQVKAILVAVDTGEYDIDVSLAELEELCTTANIEVAAKATQKRSHFDSATFVGSGRIQEIAECITSDPSINLLVFDHELSASQMRNIEEIAGVSVLDRTMLILDIFAARATTSEGKLQVELAQQKYRLPRLSGIGVNLSRLGGGIGTRGPGETKLETDRRHIRTRIHILEEQLEELEKRREQFRKRRKKDGVTVVAIVGYTNVGKSTLLNYLTDAGVLAKDMLFATLDPTSRGLILPDGRNVMLIDTVGLLRRLPHHLVNAFQSTLEEAANADLLLNVCDISSREVQNQVEVTEDLMRKLGAQDIPIITVLNKCDQLSELPTALNDHCALISAATGQGVDVLLQKITRVLPSTHARMDLLIPYDKGTLINEIRIDGKIFEETFEPQGTHIDALVEIKLVHKLEPYRTNQ